MDMQTSSMNRRAILGLLAAAPVASAAAPASATRNPDARLLAAFEEYCAAFRELRAAPETNTDQEDEVFYVRMDAASDIMMSEPAHTPAGIAAKLWVGLSHTCSDPAIGAAMLGERTLSADDEEALDYYQRLIWSALTDARRLAKAATR